MFENCWILDNYSYNLLFFDFFIGRFFCIYPADAHYCIDPRVIIKPADGL